ncbi:hypothetical protein K1T71_007273 [Dendrolimus kikuchii]|uniref:Uncharacterized protein n=1 Tax=Dendrolimus kikuchii TaxID=765133 RepID=A0ACC1D0L5_9NEOP|nr:hypothetical protein K1T71_007273 [Dendrolimus kikuchii]
MGALLIWNYLLLILVTAFLLRVVFLIYFIITNNCKIRRDSSLRTIICIGSGGHTTEMLRLTKSFDLNKYSPRLYMMADNDVNSEKKVHDTENGRKYYTINRVPRSRNVKQSFSSSMISTFYAMMQTIPIVYNFKPDVVLCNGPGTCFPICIVAFILRCLFLLDCRIVFIESICRVRTMSLTGKVLQYFADVIIVQWPQLRNVCFRAKYFGRLT